MKTAIENGICMFDEAENYADGKSELELGRVLKELGIRRADFIITSKVLLTVLLRVLLSEFRRCSGARDLVQTIWGYRASSTCSLELSKTCLDLRHMQHHRGREGISTAFTAGVSRRCVCASSRYNQCVDHLGILRAAVTREYSSHSRNCARV